MNPTYLLVTESNDVVFIPKHDFSTCFTFINPKTVTFKQIEWGIYSGGADTYLSSHKLNHIRSIYEFGDNANSMDPMTIIGIYRFEWS